MSTRPGPTTLVLELWGLGDAVLMTGALQALLAAGRRVSVLCAPASCELLAPSYPGVSFLPFRAPWTAFHGKYRLWRWPWRELSGVIAELRAARFDEALSVRPDPRDHLLMRLAGARRRCGFPRAGSGVLLSRPVARPTALRHRAEEWMELARTLLDGDVAPAAPRLARHAYEGDGADAPRGGLPLVVLHPGASQAVRRWPVAYWRELVARMRERFAFELVVIPDRDGSGGELAPCADRLATDLSLAELVRLIGRASLFLGNDSGPAHLAAALGVPGVSVFGPQHPESFAPYSATSRAVSGEPCPYRGCSDHCRFDAPRCLTDLLPRDVAQVVLDHVERLLRTGDLPDSMRRAGTARTGSSAAG